MKTLKRQTKKRLICMLMAASMLLNPGVIQATGATGTETGTGTTVTEPGTTGSENGTEVVGTETGTEPTGNENGTEPTGTEVTGAETGTTGNEAGAETGTTGNETGVEPGTTETENGTETETEAETEIETETETEIETEIEPVYLFDNSEEESAIEENTIHDVTVDVGDKKKIIVNKSSKKSIKVEIPVYSKADGSILDYDIKSLKFSGFKLESWKSSNKSVAKISKSDTETYPVVTAVAPGDTIIELLYSYSFEKEKAYYKTSAVVTVPEAKGEKEILFDTTILRGESVTYKPSLLQRTYSYINEDGKKIEETKAPQVISWTSSAPAKVSVKDGVVTGLTQGSATITLKYKYAFSDGTLTCIAKCVVTSNCYIVKGNLIYIQPSVVDDADATPAINAACVYARDFASDSKPYTVIFSSGTYKLASGTICVFSNTTLDMTAGGVVLKFAGIGGANASKQLIKLGTNSAYDGETSYNSSAKCAGYKGFRNVKFLGGTIESTNVNKSTHMVMAHATNVLLEGVTFTGGAGMHMMEVAAIDGFTVKNCVFKNFTGSKAISANKGTGRAAYAKRAGNYEALQFDIVASGDCFGGVYMDGTPMKNIKITGCTFDGVPRGVGCHTQLLGSYHSKVNISNNVFKNTAKEAIILLAFKDCKIKNNKIIGCGAGIVMENFSYSSTYVLTKVFEGTKDYNKSPVYDVNTVIAGNDISITYRGQARETVGILVYGKAVMSDYQSRRPSTGKVWGNISKNTYYISNVRVENNTIVTAGRGIHFSCARDCVVLNNQITGTDFRPGTSYNGIYASEYSVINQINGNTVSLVPGNGIAIASSSTVAQEISGNIVKQTGGSALKIGNAKNPLTVNKNFFSTKSTSSDVVNIVTGSTNKNCVTLKNNTISGVEGSTAGGIYVESGTCNIKKNKIAKVDIGVRIKKAGSDCTLGKNTYRATVTIKEQVEE